MRLADLHNSNLIKTNHLVLLKNRLIYKFYYFLVILKNRNLSLLIYLN